MRQIIFELCAETVDACLAARTGGASRIELCSGLSEGGLTPSHGLIADTVPHAGLPVHVLVRPRGGDFCYSPREFDIMCDDVRHARELKAAGVVLGILTSEKIIDIARTRTLVEAARPMQVTFHRAFDETTSLPRSLEDAISAGCDRVLTSGGQRDVLAGADTLRALVQQAGERIEIAVGGGLRLRSAASVAKITGATHFHGSLRRRTRDGRIVVESSSVEAMVRRLESASACLAEIK